MAVFVVFDTALRTLLTLLAKSCLDLLKSIEHERKLARLRRLCFGNECPSQSSCRHERSILAVALGSLQGTAVTETLRAPQNIQRGWVKESCLKSEIFPTGVCLICPF
ncbi:hypothetical protein ACMFMF_011389 [Clarireedia jacksonii]